MKELLHKYWDGNTTLEEEQQLRDYFCSDHVATEDEKYRSLFEVYELENEQSLHTDFDAFAKLENEPVKDKSSWKALKALGIAAGFAALVTVGVNTMGNNTTSKDTYDNPQEAYNATVNALQLVSAKFNNGRENLKPLNEINNQTEKVFKKKDKQ